MSLLQIVVLALVQGVSEFLPISSSGHLILVPALIEWPDQGRIVDVAAHVGTLGAVVLYFRRDIASMTVGLGDLLRRRPSNGARLIKFLILASIPAMLAGYAIVTLDLGPMLRSPLLIACTLIGFGLLLYAVDRLAIAARQTEQLRMSDVLFIGLAQTLALVPGTSRAGITMTAGRLLGMKRDEAARFSMLLSVPTILAAGLHEGYELYKLGDYAMGVDALLTAAFSFVTGLATIAFLMRWLQRSTFTPFVIYRVALGLALIAWLYL